MDSRFFIVFADILLPLLLGMALRRWGLSREILRMVIKANVVCVATFLSLVSFWSVHVTKELLWLPISIIPICFIPVLIFYGFQKTRFQNPLDQGSYMISMMLGNIGTLAGLCAYVLYGEKGFAYVQLIAVPQILVIVLFCFPMAQRFYEMGAQRTMETKDKLYQAPSYAEPASCPGSGRRSPAFRISCGKTAGRGHTLYHPHSHERLDGHDARGLRSPPGQRGYLCL